MKRKAFTLVELIVVITILAILGTIAFISLQGYSSSARDSTRLSDIGSIKKVLELYALDKGKYPEPTLETNTISYSGSEIWTQGYFGDTTLKNTQKLSNIPLDPLTKTPYTYSLLNTKKEYEIAMILESELGKISNIANAEGDKVMTSHVSGNYNGKISKVEIAGVDYILAVPTLINANLGLGDYQDIVNTQALAYKGTNTIAGGYTGTIVNTLGTLQKIVNPSNIVLYSGDLKDIDAQIFLSNLQSAYTGTDISSSSEINNILSLGLNTTESNKYASNLINSISSNTVINETVIDTYNDQYTKLLLIDSLSDSSSSNHSLTLNGTPEYDSINSEFVFGGDTEKDYITISDSEDFNFGAGDFTIDFWINPSIVGFQSILSQGTDLYGYRVDLDGSNAIRFFAQNASTGGAGWGFGLFGNTYTIPANTDSHIAISREGNNWYLFINGVLQTTITDSRTIYDSTSNLYIGGSESYTTSRYMNGTLKDIRISKGIARWTSNFAPNTIK